MNPFKAICKQAQSKRGITLLEVMMCATIMVISATASLQFYLQTALIVEDAKEKTIAMTHNKMVMEEIRSWLTLSDDAINFQDWQAWLGNRVGEGALLPAETIVVSSQDWVTDFPTSPRRVVVKTTWDGVRGQREMRLVGGFI